MLTCRRDEARFSPAQEVADTYPGPALTGDTWTRGKWDVEFWAKAYLGIRLHPGQVEMTQAYLKRTTNGYRALYLNITVSAGNRAGKTMCLAIIIMHSCVYRMGLKPPEDPDDPELLRHWGEQPYHWWHFAVEQGPAEQTFHEISAILGGVHEAQKRGCPWTKMVGEGDRDLGVSRIATLTDTGNDHTWCKGTKERGEYAWIRFAKEFGGAEIHFRSTKAKALSAIGMNMHGLSMDEAGLEPNLTYLMKEVFHARRLSTGGQFIVISTPSVATSVEFIDLWYTGDPEDPYRNPRRFSMRMSTRQNIGFGTDQEDFDALLLGQDEAWIAQNIDGMFIQAVDAWFNKHSIDAVFKEGLPADEEPGKGLWYLHSLDPGLKDKCWSIVFKVLPNGRIRGVSIDRQVGKQTTRGIVALGKRHHERFAKENHVDTGVDTTALGGHMFCELLTEEGVEHRDVEFGGNGKAKREMLSDLRSAIDEGRIEMPDTDEWQPAKRQLIGYKLLDRKIEQDLVMGLAIIAKLLRAIPPGAGTAGGPQTMAFDMAAEAHPEKPREDPTVYTGLTPTQRRLARTFNR